jgi:short-subunit dehydrogenase
MNKKKVMLTGASDGIGKAIAIEFARRGHSLALMARRLDKLEAVRQECLSAGASQVRVYSIDVTQEALFQETLDRADADLGGTTVFIANAGVTGRSCYDAKAWEYAKNCLQVNVMATIHGLEWMKVKMLARGRGTLCGVSSIAGARGMPTAGAYSTSKAALSIHLETMRVDLKPRGIRVVDVAPGFIDTEMTKKNKGKMPFLMQPSQAAEIFVDGILKGRPFVVAPKIWGPLYPILQMIPRWIFDWAATRSYKTIRGSPTKN